MPAGPEDGQPDRKASRGVQGRVGEGVWHQGQQWEPQLSARREAGHPQEIRDPCFFFSLTKTSRQYQRSLSGAGVAKGVQG